MADETVSPNSAPASPPAPAAAAQPAIPSAPSAAAPAAVAATPPAQVPVPVEVVPPEMRIKVRKPKQRSCDEKDAKGKLCAGHLKRWYDYPKNVVAKIGTDAEIYRCEFCKSLYRPDPKQMPNSFTLRY